MSNIGRSTHYTGIYDTFTSITICMLTQGNEIYFFYTKGNKSPFFDPQKITLIAIRI